jgi:hypothetical protein
MNRHLKYYNQLSVNQMNFKASLNLIMRENSP